VIQVDYKKRLFCLMLCIHVSLKELYYICVFDIYLFVVNCMWR